MKKLIALITAFFLFGFSNTQENAMILKVVKMQSLGADKCIASLELHNKFNHKINFLSMYCSFEGFYITDNPNVVVVPKPCDKNFPISVPIARNSYRPADLELQVKNTKAAKFKIGFKFIEIPKGVVAVEFDTTAVKSITIWSNAIEYKGR